MPELDQPDFAYLAPQAAGNTWYPYSFLEPLERNEPYLSSALAVVGGLVKQVTAAGFSTEKIMLLGFSQGACLTLEFAARNAATLWRSRRIERRGVIGADDTPRDYPGAFDGTPVFIGMQRR